MARHLSGWWAERIAELARGEDIAVVARRHGVSVRLLKWWKWKLGSETLTSMPRSRTSTASRRQRLLPVVIAPAPVTNSPVGDELNEQATTIIETLRGRITMRGQLSAEQLAAVVAELVRG
ncbi:MAG: hypothetical protein KF850_01890 [Labilithrix sp.]|nr:hypothetical protein [Labilithrix sp.]